MPLYEYHCNACAHVQEELRAIAERDTPAMCETCGGSSPRDEIATGVGHRIDRAKRMYAVLDNGRKVEGHFGKSARNKKSLGW